MHDTLPAEIVAFLRERVTSLEELETLLRVRSEAAREWTLDELAASLGTPATAIHPALVQLAAQQLISQSRATGWATWRYAPGTAELRGLVDGLAEIYDAHRLEVMRLLTTQAVDRLRSSAARAFSDAFLMGRKKGG